MVDHKPPKLYGTEEKPNIELDRLKLSEQDSREESSFIPNDQNKNKLKWKDALPQVYPNN